MEIQFDSRIKFQVYDLQERKLLKTSELKAIMNEIMSLKNNEVEFLSNERYCISSFLNFQDKKCNDLFEGDIVLCQFKDKFTKKNKEKKIKPSQFLYEIPKSNIKIFQNKIED